MISFRVINRQAGFVITIGALLLALVAPTIASAAQVTERSIALSSSSKNADDVSYTVEFKAVGAAGAFVIDFCNDSPIVGEDCTPPTGFDASGADSTSAGVTDVAGATSTIVVEKSISAGAAVSVVLTGIDNPSASGVMYARIVTYTDTTAAGNYAADDVSGSIDRGSIAVQINETIGVTAAVLESMTFCVSAQDIAAGCTEEVVGTDGGALDAPTLKLGETVGDTVALNSNNVSTGSIYTQLSTNAVGGAIVNLKSNAIGCGGLLLDGDPDNDCDIVPAVSGSTGITAGQAKFGVKTSTAVSKVGANGTFQVRPATIYGNTNYAMNWVNGDGSGVTSVFGDPFLDTNGDPVNNKTMQLTFGASISNSTPAGLYSADLSLIATGKF